MMWSPEEEEEEEEDFSPSTLLVFFFLVTVMNKVHFDVTFKTELTETGTSSLQSVKTT